VRGLLVIVPSRGRPGRLAEMLAETFGNATAETEVAVGLDDNDPVLEGYRELSCRPQRGMVHWHVGPHQSMTAWTNDIVRQYKGRYRAYASFGDDHLPRTRAWDKLLLDAALPVGISYGNDLLQRENLPTAPVVTAGIVDALGWLCLPTVRHYYCVVPDTPVLATDLRWIPAGKVAPGDELVGVNEHRIRRAAAKASWSFRPTRVEDVRWRQAECVTVELEDGRQITCSVDHKWLALRRRVGTGFKGAGTYEWRSSYQLCVGDQLVSPSRMWGGMTLFQAGSLSGLFNDEGCLAGRRGFPRSPNRALFSPIGLRTRWDAIELPSRQQPGRLVPAEVRERARSQAGRPVYGVVRRVLSAGQAEVVSMRTSTRTFIANGLVAHNCDNAWLDLGRGAACLRYLPRVIIEHMHPARLTAPKDSTYTDALSSSWRADKAAYEQWRHTGRDGDVATLRELMR
jgi:hypothetical protein